MVATSEYNLFSREPIRSLEDIAGKKIACSNGVESDLFAALGAIPIGCSTPEGKQAYEGNEVFAISISDSAAHTVGLYKFANYRTSANLVRVNLEYGLSPSFYAQLPEDLKEILNHWLRALAQAGAQLFYGLAGARACEAFQQNNMEFIRLEPAEQQRWRDKVSPVREQLIQQLNAKTYNGSEIVSDILQWAKHYADFSADELMQESLDHPFTDLLP
jgi:TRAP-type C4-dicarboxylate transport system substrate-binding protein